MEPIDISSEEDKEKIKNSACKSVRKQHFFEHHIRKVLLEVCPERDITQQAKSQLNELLIITCKIIVRKAVNILESTKKKTITEAELEFSVRLIFSGQLAQKSIDEGKRCQQKYSSNSGAEEFKGHSRHSKADILIPPSILEKFIRTIGPGHRMSQFAPVFLAGVIEYFLAQILDLANNVSSLDFHDKDGVPFAPQAQSTSGVRMTVFDLEYGVRMDKEVNTFFSENNIHFFEVGTIPFIHPSLKDKDGGNDKKSLKIITKIQENNEYIFPKSVFENKIKNNFSLIYPELRYQKDCFSVIQDYVEKSLVEVLRNANNITLHSGRNRVTVNDIEMVLSIIEKRLPDFLIKNYDDESLSSDSSDITILNDI
jgi:histone H3/H4